MVKIVLANQITWTVIVLLYFGHILWRIFKIRWSESYWPIRSLGRLFNRYQRSQPLESSSRSDGQTLKPKSLTRKSLTIMSAISRLRAKVGLSRPQLSRLRAKAVPRMHKPHRAHKSLTRKSRTIMSAISRLRAKVGLSRPQ